jgi:Tfp pilus assembly pilus retraction ATPase PilT
MSPKIEEILKFAIERNASDVHLISDVSPKIRLNGELLDVPGFEIVDRTLNNQMVLSLLDVTISLTFSKYLSLVS